MALIKIAENMTISEFKIIPTSFSTFNLGTIAFRKNLLFSHHFDLRFLNFMTLDLPCDINQPINETHFSNKFNQSVYNIFGFIE
jgi:hypothetical protein